MIRNERKSINIGWIYNQINVWSSWGMMGSILILRREQPWVLRIFGGYWVSFSSNEMSRLFHVYDMRLELLNFSAVGVVGLFVLAGFSSPSGDRIGVVNAFHVWDIVWKTFSSCCVWDSQSLQFVLWKAWIIRLIPWTKISWDIFNSIIYKLFLLISIFYIIINLLNILIFTSFIGFVSLKFVIFQKEFLSVDYQSFNIQKE